MSNSASLTDGTSAPNIELGAGVGKFGKIFYPQCYLTDLDKNLAKVNPDIDFFCSATDLYYWGADRFDIIIMCNPFNYGFATKESTESLMKELLRVIKKESSYILVIGHTSNTWSAPDVIKIRIAEYIEKNPLPEYVIEVKEEALDLSKEYSGYSFYQSDGKTPTRPNFKTHIYVRRSTT